MKYIYYYGNCHNGHAAYAFETFEEAFEWAKQATTWDDNKIKQEIKIQQKDTNNGFMIWVD